MASASPPTPDAAALARSHLAAATLARASLFLGAGLETACPDNRALRPIEGPYRAKVLGNGLRELDRFLSVLIDEIAAAIRPEGIDRAHLTRQRNTPNKLRLIRASLGLPSPDHEQLRAIGRSRDCLFHCGGVVKRYDTPRGAGMVPGWPQSPGTPARRRAALRRGERLGITPMELELVCQLYDRVALELIAAGADHLRIR